MNVDTSYIPVVSEPETTNSVTIPTVKVISKTIPLQEREYEVQCNHCNAALQFRQSNIHKNYSSLYAYMWTGPDVYEIKCPNCENCVSVKNLLPKWLLKKV